MNLSTVIITKNEAINIERCLAALAWCDDVLVVDDFSTDETARLAEAHGARVVPHAFESFAGQRNWALDSGNLKHVWVLFLDADEVVTEAFRDALAQAVATANNETAGFLLCRKTMFLDGWLKYSDGFPVWIMRVVRHGRARFVDSGHGEVPAPPVDGTLGKVREPFLHYPFSKGLDEWQARHAAYAQREAELELSGGERFVWRDLFSTRREDRRRAQRALSRRLPGRAWLRFCFHFFAKRGFLDGRAGLEYARLMARYEARIVAHRRALLSAQSAPPLPAARP
jgi:glycosyltransferase involved in cell wall biosynthesis